MATYIENNINVTNDSIVEYSLSLYGGEPFNVTVGLTKNKNWIGKYTFFNADNIEVFGNGCKFNSVNDAIDYIKDKIRYDIDRGLNPGDLLINGIKVDAFIKVSEFNLF